jgi:hypothetical protein
MANRTVQIRGQGYGTSPAQITVAANGNTVFSGTIATVDQPLPALPMFLPANLAEILCTFEIDLAFTGQIPMTCVVNSGKVIFAEIFANYVLIINPVYTSEQIATLTNPSTTQADRVIIYTQVANPPLSQQDIDTLLDPAATPEQKNTILVAHNCQTRIPSGASGYGPIDNTDSRSSVTIDGTAQMPDHGELPGTWWWAVGTGSVLAYQLDVDPAVV